MESDNWKPTQPQTDQPSDNVKVGDWRSNLSATSRRKVIDNILEKLKKYCPHSAELSELNRIAEIFENKIYTAASSQADYLRKITVKLLSIENKTQSTAAGSLAANPASGSQNHMEPVPDNMQVQRNNQASAVLLPPEINQPQAFQQALAQNVAGIIASSGSHSSASLASTLPPVSGMKQSPVSNLMNSSNMQNMAGASLNENVNTMGKGVASSMFINQKETPGRQWETPVHQRFQLQQPQNIMKQVQIQQGISPNSNLRSPIREQHLQQSNQMQSLQQLGNSTPSDVLMQHTQSLPQQQHPRQISTQHQQQGTHQSTRLSQPQQQRQTSQSLQSIVDHQMNTTNMRPAQLFGHQSISEMPQKPQIQISQQNSILNLQQQQQLIAPQPEHMGHQGNVSGHQQKLHGVASSKMDMQPNQHQIHLAHQNNGHIPLQNQQPTTSLLANQGQHSHPPQLHIMPESVQLQTNMSTNQQRHDVQQKLQSSGTLMLSHNIGDQQNQMHQSQRALTAASSASADSVSHRGQASSGNWQEEVHKKITSLKGIYFDKIRILYLKVSQKIQQLASLPHQSKEQLGKLNNFRSTLKGIMTYLVVNKSDVTPDHGERLPDYEKLILNVLNAYKLRRPEPVQSFQQTHSQETHLNPSLQADNSQAPVKMKQINTSLQQNSVYSMSGVSNAQGNMFGAPKLEPNVEAGQGSRLASSQQGVDGYRLQNPINAPQQTNMNAVSTGNCGNLIKPNMSNLQAINSVNYHHVKQFQQQFHQQNKHQQPARPLSHHQLPQLQQMTKVNDENIQRDSGTELGAFPQNHISVVGKHSVYRHQLKAGVSSTVSSPQMLQISCPQIPQTSPFMVPSPSTLAPNATSGNTSVQQSGIPHAPTKSLAVEDFGMSASPLLAEFSNQDGAHDATVTKSSITEEPVDRLIRSVKSISNEALTASVNDIGFVVSLFDRIAGSAPGHGSRAVVGDDLSAMAKFQMHAKNLASQDKSIENKKMKRCFSSLPLVVLGINGSWNGNFTQSAGSELESTATSRAKRPRTEVNPSLLKEVSDINQRLIDTMVDICEEDVNPCTATDVVSEGGKGVIVKCFYTAVALSPDLKSQYATTQLSPIQPLRLLVPSNYPDCSPVLLDKLPIEVSNDKEDLSMKAMSMFTKSLRTLSQPMSLKEIVRTWDSCTRATMTEYAQARGGGSFSSNYGSWECVF